MHRGQWRVTVAVPRELVALLGATRLKHPLNTDSRSVAEIAKRPYVRRFKQQIEDARNGLTSDPYRRNAEVLAAARIASDDLADREAIDFEIAHITSVIAGKPIDENSDFSGDRYARYDPQRERQAAEFAGIASGELVPIEAHYPAYMAQLKVKGRTVADDKRALSYLLKWCEREGIAPTLQAITKRRAVTFIDDLPKLVREIGATTVRKYMNRLSQYWKWLIAREHTSANVWREISVPVTPVMDHERERAFTNEEMLSLLKGRTSQEMHDLMRIAALSGARLDAVVCLSAGDCADGLSASSRKRKRPRSELSPSIRLCGRSSSAGLKARS